MPRNVFEVSIGDIIYYAGWLSGMTEDFEQAEQIVKDYKVPKFFPFATIYLNAQHEETKTNYYLTNSVKRGPFSAKYLLFIEDEFNTATFKGFGNDKDLLESNFDKLWEDFGMKDYPMNEKNYKKNDDLAREMAEKQLTEIVFKDIRDNFN